MQEAVMKMDLSADSFLVYKAVEDGGVRVIFRRNDGNYGIIQPE
jgi:putative sigma-54 modulation protein